MQWPTTWPFTRKSTDDTKPSPSSELQDLKEHLSNGSWSDFTTPSTLVSTVILTGSILLTLSFYKRFLRRIPNVSHIRPEHLRKNSFFGRVTSVGDGDNFRLYHTPGGRLAGWGWLPGRKVPGEKKELKDQTVHVRLAGVDAPELAHFGRPAQEYGKEALEFLTEFLLHKRARAYVYRKDQYERVVGTVYVRKWGIRRDVGLEMLKRGLATVYEAKFGSEFGGKEKVYRAAMEMARQKRVGMWKEASIWEKITGTAKTVSESPREYKTRMVQEEKARGGNAAVKK